MASGSLATEVIITEVEFVMAAASVVMSTLLPAASFSSSPNSSMNAPRVPEPSSREYTEISLLAWFADESLFDESEPFDAQPTALRRPKAQIATSTAVRPFLIKALLISIPFFGCASSCGGSLKRRLI